MEDAEEGVWDYIVHLLESKNNRGKVEGGSYLVYALLDYVVDSYVGILQSFAEDIRHIEQNINDDSSIFQVFVLLCIHLVCFVIA